MIQVLHTTGLRYDAPLCIGARCVCKLMEEDYIELPFTTKEAVHFEIGDYVDLASEAYDGLGLPAAIRKRYAVKSRQVPTYNTGTGGYDWRLRMDAHYWLWDNRVFKFNPDRNAQEASWGLTDKIGRFLDIFTRDLEAYGFGSYTYTIDDELKEYNINLSFQGTKMIEALKMICDKVAEEYNTECEWWVEGSSICIGRCEHADRLPLVLTNEGQGINVESIVPDESDQEYANRLIVFGGTQNLSARYRKVLYFGGTTRWNYNHSGILVRDDTKTDFSIEWFKVSERRYPEASTLRYSTPTSAVSLIGDVERANVTILAPTEHTRTIGNYTVNGVRQHVDATVTVEMSVADFERMTEDGYPSTTGGRVPYQQRVASARLVMKKGGKTIVLTEQEAEQKQSTSTSVCVLRCNDDVAFMDSEDVGVWSIVVECSVTVEPKQGSFVYGNNWAYFNISAEATLHPEDVYCIDTKMKIDGTEYDATVNPYFFDKYDSRSQDILIIGIAQEEGRELRYSFPTIITGKVDVGYFEAEDAEESIVNSIVQRNLMLPKRLGRNYIDVVDGLQPEQVVEKVVTFDKIYPKQELNIGSVGHYTTETEEEDPGQQDVGIKGGVLTKTHYHYQFMLDDLDFSDDCLIEGVDLGVHFETGKLAGLDFQVAWKPTNDTIGTGDDAHRWEIINNTNYGIELPNSSMKPKGPDDEWPGDKVIITGWNIEALDADKGLVEQAEEELLREGEKMAERIAIDPHTYTIKIMSDYARRDIERNLPSRLGRKVTIRNGYLFEHGSREVRVIGYEVKLDVPYDTPTITAGEQFAKSALKAAKTRLTAISNSQITAVPIVTSKTIQINNQV